MQKWEYHTFSYWLFGGDGESEFVGRVNGKELAKPYKRLSQYLDEFGEAGWEAVGLTADPHSNEMGRILFKRPKA